ncbi:ABC transporter ATP-binding protein [Gordonia sp. OPL2]|uniref:ABC transporter ATP-binding protein n=1 Tax=Gordonia sp. OPL2 TaxID=2486274 RepID=UPI0016553418|nr:ABC transporter ATP-binding protein [Gordonia sp. OPL2]RPA12095.1 ABC transporter ATP-binding protein [Gordonia sp. OPL2]
MRIIRPVRTQVMASMLLQMLCAVMVVGAYIAIVAAVRRPADTGEVSWTPVVVASLLFLAVPVVHACSYSASFAASRRIELRLRTEVTDHVSRIPLGWFTSGSAVTRLRKTVNSDIAAVTGMIGEALPNTARYSTVTVVAFGYLFTVSWILAAVVAVPVVIASAVEWRRMGMTSEADRRHEETTAELSARTTELTQGIGVAKIFGMADRENNRFRRAADAYADSYLRREIDQQRRGRVTSVLASWMSILSIVVVGGTALVSADLIDAVDVVAFLMLSWIVSRGVWALPMALMTWRRARNVLGGVDAILGIPPLPTPDEAPRMPTAPVTVTFDHVGFGYTPDEPTLQDISLRLAPGTTTALVGASGSGKSTLARLVPRFWDVDTGSIRMNETDVRDLAPTGLYRLVSFVFQDVTLMRSSVADNIRLARPDADQATVEAAARAARIHDRIERLPRGYDSVVGVDAHFSGGEAQRISIARALVADTPVVVLDEATSAADPESEAAVGHALARLMEGRTVLTIAHRLATIASADQIVVLDHGRVAEIGTHDELTIADGHYARMWRADRMALR